MIKAYFANDFLHLSDVTLDRPRTAWRCATATASPSAVVDFHQAQGRLATLSAVKPAEHFGALHPEGHRITRFEEEPQGAVASSTTAGHKPSLAKGCCTASRLARLLKRAFEVDLRSNLDSSRSCEFFRPKERMRRPLSGAFPSANCLLRRLTTFLAVACSCKPTTSRTSRVGHVSYLLRRGVPK